DRNATPIALFTPDRLGNVGNVIWAADGKSLLVLANDSKSTTQSVKRVEAVSGGKITTLFSIDVAKAPLDRLPELLSISPDGQFVAVALLAGVRTGKGATVQGIRGVEIWNINSGKKVSSLSLTQSGLLDSQQIAWAPDGSQVALVTGNQSDTVQIYSVGNGALRSSFKDSAASKQGIGALSWSPDGAFLAESTLTIRIWDVRAHKIVSNFGQVDAQHLIAALAWSSDSKRLVSATIESFSSSHHTTCTEQVWKLF
ncbi:MAG TPA: hypothetical protein VFN35_08190, partial [Ktedonobacteraceae bacterium]|nr:hypothetical protein [Ktedonobacteraceae bacterium]